MGDSNGQGNQCNNQGQGQPCRTTTTTSSPISTITFPTTESMPTPTKTHLMTTIVQSTTLRLEESKTAAVTTSDKTTVYIVVSVTIGVIALLTLCGFFLWRRRKGCSRDSNSKGGSGSLIRNVEYGENRTDRNRSVVEERHSRTNEYAEIALDMMNPDIPSGDNYQTIDILPDANKTDANNTKSYPEVTDMNYSHIDIKKGQKNVNSCDTYALRKIVNTADKRNTKQNDDNDETYNKLNTIRTNKQKEEEDTEYNHIHAGGGQDLPNENDNYSHLDNSTKSSDEPAKVFYDNKNRNNDTETRQPTQADNVAPRIVEYEFAKDFDNLNGTSGMPENENIAERKSDFDKTEAKSNTNGTDTGKNNGYSILEHGAEVNAKSVFVVEDEASQQNDEINSHEYFILEKN